MHWRQQWLAALRSATSVREVAQMLLQLEAELRPLAFKPEWRVTENTAGLAPTGTNGGPAGAASTPGAGQGGGSRPPSRTVSRAPSTADLEGMAAGEEQLNGEVSASLAAGTEGGEVDGSAAAAAARAADPYDVRYERPVMKGWEVDRRHHSARVHGVNRLPLAALRKVRFPGS
jgi:hypothetical protein